MSTPSPPLSIRYRHPRRSLDIRPPHPAQAPALIEAIHASLPELRAFKPWAHLEHTVGSQFTRLIGVQSDYWQGNEYLFTLYDPDEEIMLGCMGLHRRSLNSECLELGYWVRSDRAGQGTCTLAARCLVIVAFEHFGCDRLQCGYNEHNAGSARVNAKVGFEEEARLTRFETVPTPEMVAAGMRLAPRMVLNAMFPEDRPRLSWYDEVKAHLHIDTLVG